MTLSVKLRALVLFSAGLLLLTASCAKLGHFLDSTDAYHTKTYKSVCDEWTREASINTGLKMELIASATFKSKEFRRAYAAEYAEAYKLTSEEEKDFLNEQIEADAQGYEFLMASFVSEDKWNDFDKRNSMWKLYLITDQGKRVLPLEVNKIKQKDAVIPHFFPYVTPWKSIYTIRFPRRTSTKEPAIKTGTSEIKLIIASVLGTAEMVWKLK